MVNQFAPAFILMRNPQVFERSDALETNLVQWKIGAESELARFRGDIISILNGNILLMSRFP